MHTPWGPSQSTRTYAEGVVHVSTASHGGFYVSAELMATFPEHLLVGLWNKRTPGTCGWFEEDLDWARVALAFPELFTERDKEAAESTVRNSWPDVWEKHYGRELQPGESSEKDKRAFYAAHKGDYLVISAVGSSSHNGVPEKMVGVCARIGGHDNPHGMEKCFLVPEAEYRQRGKFSFVIDPTRHPETDETYRPTKEVTVGEFRDTIAKVGATAALVLCMIVGAHGQERAKLPDNPQPQPQAQQFEPERIGPHHGRSFAVLFAATTLATVADVESTAHCENFDPKGHETSTIYGRNPSRARMYGISMGVNAGLALYGEFLRRKAPQYNHWWARMVLLPSLATHTAGAIHNVAVCR